MNVKLLVDAIVQQTTVLIAQLSTAAGVRAPLAHLADQVFLSLSREIEAQGVKRKVVADMFGLALRGYQKKTRRASASVSVQGKTLFEAILDYVERQQGVSRDLLLQRFRHDNEREVVGVVNDLVQSGLLYSTGAGASTLYGVTTEAERQKFTRHSDALGLASMAVGAIYRSRGLTPDELASALNVSREEADRALQSLRADDQIRFEGERAFAPTFQIAIGAEHGWEAAVFDHFQAVATAIATKVQLKAARGTGPDLVGGTTLRFEVSRAHPRFQEVLGLLAQVRAMTDEIWDHVNDWNLAHPSTADERINISFYFGQNIDDPTLLGELHSAGAEPTE